MGSRACVYLLALAGCGRLGFDFGDTPPGSPPPPDAVPVVCAPHQWTTLNLPVGLDVAVAATPSGLAVAWAQTAGSAIGGALLDPAMQLTPVNPVKTGTYISSSLAYVDGTLASAEVEPGSAVKYDTANSDLSNASEFACPIASIVPKPAVLHAGPDVIALSGYDNGLTVWPIVNWAQKPSQLQQVTAPVTAMAAAEVGPVAAVIWSTVDTCHVELVTNAATGTTRSMPAACANVRLASDGVSLVAAYERGGEIAIARGDTASLDATIVWHTIAGATSPRVVYDGTRYWVSYLDSATGEVVLGTENGNGQFVTTSTGHVPASGAYDLGVLDGQVWVAAVDTTGLATDNVCLR